MKRWLAAHGLRRIVNHSGIRENTEKGREKVANERMDKNTEQKRWIVPMCLINEIERYLWKIVQYVQDKVYGILRANATVLSTHFLSVVSDVTRI